MCCAVSLAGPVREQPRHATPPRRVRAAGTPGCSPKSACHGSRLRASRGGIPNAATALGCRGGPVRGHPCEAGLATCQILKSLNPQIRISAPSSSHVTVPDIPAEVRGPRQNPSSGVSRRCPRRAGRSEEPRTSCSGESVLSPKRHSRMRPVLFLPRFPARANASRSAMPAARSRRAHVGPTPGTRVSVAATSSSPLMIMRWSTRARSTRG